MSTCTRCTGRLALRDLDKVARRGQGRGGGLTITASLFYNNNNNNNSFGYLTSLDQCYMTLFLPLIDDDVIFDDIISGSSSLGIFMFLVLPCRRARRGLPQSLQNLCDWNPVVLLTGNTCVYNDSVMSESKHMCFFVWGKKTKMLCGSAGLTNTHFHPDKPVYWCSLDPQHWDCLEATASAFFPTSNIYVACVFLLDRNTMNASFGFMEH